MSENKQPHELDFYSEALKAFDVPSYEVEAPAQEPPVEEVPAEVRLDAPPENPDQPVRRPRWWLAVTAAVLGLVLLITLWPDWFKRPQNENYVFGSIVYEADDAIVVQNAAGERWYVELNGLEAPAMSEFGIVYVWAFYGGEPKATDLLGCTKMVTATRIQQSDRQLQVRYGAMIDQCLFDLDADGSQETWLLCAGRTSGVVSYRLVALEQNGTCKYDVTVFNVTYGTHFFHHQDEQLQIIGPDAALSVRLESREISVYNGERKLQTIDNLMQHEEQITIGAAQTSTVWGGIYAENQMEVCTERMQLTQAQTSTMREILNSLEWQDHMDTSVARIAGFIAVESTGGSNRYYFDYNGNIHCGGKYAAMDQEVWSFLMSLMTEAGGSLDGISGRYAGVDADGQEVMVSLSENGESQLYFLPEVYGGKFAIVGDYLFLASYSTPVFFEPPDSGKNTLRTYIFRLQDSLLTYIADASVQDRINIADAQQFRRDSAIDTVSIRLCPITPPGGETVSETSVRFGLTTEQRESLQNVFAQLQWETVRGDSLWSPCTLIVETVGGTVKEYGFLNDRRMTCDGLVATLNQDQWDAMVDILRWINFSSSVDMEYSATDNGYRYTLELSKNASFTLRINDALLTTCSGYYWRIGRLLYLWDQNGNGVMLAEQSDGTYVYDFTGNGTFDMELPDGLVFEVMRMALEFTCDLCDECNIVGIGKLTFAQTEKIHQIVGSLDWLPRSDNGIPLIGYISSYQDNCLDHWLRADGTICSADYEAKLSREDWGFFLNLLIGYSDPYADAHCFAYLGEELIILDLYEADHSFVLASGNVSISYKFMRFGSVVLCVSQDGQLLTLTQNSDGSLRYHPGDSYITTWDLPADLCFVPSTVIVLPETS